MTIRRGLVLGCGGTVGGAWTVGALARVADRLSWDPRTAEVIVGTSSGSSIAAMLGAGIGVADLVAAQRDEPDAPAVLRRFFLDPPAARPPLPWPALTSARYAARSAGRLRPLDTLAGLAPRGRGSVGFLHRLAARLTNGERWVTHPATWVVALELDSGRRVAFGADGAPTVPLGTALAASWAIPGWYGPMSAHGRRYVDGGVASPCSLDLLLGCGLDEIVLLAPMVSTGPRRARDLGAHAESLLRRRMSQVADAEVAAAQAAGVRVLRVHPEPADLDRMGANFMAPGRRLAALEAGLGLTAVLDAAGAPA